MSWLYYGLLYIMSIRPVVMTASRRSRLVADSESLSLAMTVIAELREQVASWEEADAFPESPSTKEASDA